MNREILDRRRAERFAQLLDETNGGPRHHTRARNDDQLAELVAVGHALSNMRPTANLDPEFRSSLRTMLMAAAERDGIGVTAHDDGHGAHAAEREPRRRGLFGVGAGRRVRARGAILIGVAAGALAVSGMSAASENAVPGDALYGVKRSTERAQLALAGSDVTRGQLFLDFARNRLIEAGAVDLGGSGLTGVLADMDADSLQGVRLLTTSAVQRKNEAPLNAVDSFVTGQRRQVGALLERLDGGANRERALRSMTLLEDIDRRVRGLRNSLECGPDGVAGSDAMGPKPRACGADSDGTGKRGRDSGAEQGRSSVGRPNGAEPENDSRSVAPGPSAADPDAGPDADRSRGSNGSSPGPSGAVSPQPTAPPASTDDGLLDRIFGDLLG